MVAKQSRVNDVPMVGKGVYKANSGLQHQALLKAMPQLREAALYLGRMATPRSSSSSSHSDFSSPASSMLSPLFTASPYPDLLRVVEYGAAHANNSLVPLETILAATSKPQVSIALNDRPQNDFNTASLTLQTWQDELDRTQYPHELFISLLPRSFYQPQVQPQSADLGYSFAALHFFENTPDLPDGHFEPSRRDETMEIFRSRAQTDLRKFLKHRATEIVPGGQLVVSLCATGFAEPDYMTSGPGHSIRTAMRNMYSEGVLTRAMLNAYIIPCYFRTLADVDDTLDVPEMRSLWTTVKTGIAQTEHPAFDTLLDKQQQHLYSGAGASGAQMDQMSADYARSMIDWFTAVSAGYFLKAVKTGAAAAVEEGGLGREITETEAQDLLEVMKQRAAQVYLEKFRDQPIHGSFIYLTLQRRELNPQPRDCYGNALPSGNMSPMFGHPSGLSSPEFNTVSTTKKRMGWFRSMVSFK